MSPRPIYRWKSFWAGILIITFLAWTWWHSLHQWTMMRFRDYTVAHAGSGICISDWKLGRTKSPSFDHGKIGHLNETWAHPRLEAPDFFRSTGAIDQGSDYFIPDPQTFEDVPRSSAAQHFNTVIYSRLPGTWALFLPHWLLILTFTAIFSLFLLWRHRRLRHLTKPIG